MRLYAAATAATLALFCVSSADAADTAGQALIKFLTAPAAVPVLKSKGLEPG